MFIKALQNSTAENKKTAHSGKKCGNEITYRAQTSINKYD
jgi:hypothetical protein